MPTSKVINERSLRQLSRTVSHALRHKPWLYELELDSQGWVSVVSLLESLRLERPEWRGLSPADLQEMIRCSDKQRHEFREGRIRAIYGHSLPGKLARVPAEPPPILYHGTSPQVVQEIMIRGLLPMNRQYIHLSVDLETATAVGRRKSQKPSILHVAAAEAHGNGVQFYLGDAKVWLADEIPSRFIRLA